MGQAREAILFIPGGEVGRSGVGLARLRNGIVQCLGGPRVQCGEIADGRFTCTLDDGDGTQRIVDVIEGAWSEFRLGCALTQASLWERAWAGLLTVVFWLTALRSLASKAVLLAIGAGLTMTLVGSWYAVTVLFLVDQLAAGNLSTGIDVADQMLSELGAAAAAFGMTKGRAWLLLTAVMGLPAVTGAVDLANFVRTYLSTPAYADEGIRCEIRTRLLAKLRDLANGDYEQVTILAHSFGTVVALDVLSSYRETRAVRMISVGSAIPLLLRMSDLQPLLEEVQAGPMLASWRDFCFANDFLCAPVPQLAAGKVEHHVPVVTSDWWDKASGRVHNYYFWDRSVMERILYRS